MIDLLETDHLLCFVSQYKFISFGVDRTKYP